MARRRDLRTALVEQHDAGVCELLDLFASTALSPHVSRGQPIKGAVDSFGDHCWAIGVTGVRVVLYHSPSALPKARPDAGQPEPSMKLFLPVGVDEFEMQNYRLLADELSRRTGLEVEIRH